MMTRHRHRLEAVAVQPDKSRPVLFGPPPPPATIVLYRCGRCHHAETATLNGTWTLTQVGGQQRIVSPVENLGERGRAGQREIPGNPAAGWHAG